MENDTIIKGLEDLRDVVIPLLSSYYGSGYSSMFVTDRYATIIGNAINALDNQDGWITEKRNGDVSKTNLVCACGNPVLFDVIQFKDGGVANRLFCTSCGLQMRSSIADSNGEWIKSQWRKVFKQ